jgi:hypothetical protein
MRKFVRLDEKAKSQSMLFTSKTQAFRNTESKQREKIYYTNTNQKKVSTDNARKECATYLATRSW